MPPDNPSHILLELDARLDHPVELTLIGKSAIWLGYDNPPEGFGSTLDVDTVVPIEFSQTMDEDMGFWDALQAANHALSSLGL